MVRNFCHDAEATLWDVVLAKACIDLLDNGSQKMRILVGLQIS